MGIIASRFGPVNSISDEGGWWRNLRPSNTGRVYNEFSAMAISTVFSCCKVLAQGIAQLPLAVFERNSGRVYEHPVSWLLSTEANPNMTSPVLRETLQGHKSSWGNLYAEIEFNNKDEAAAIWPLRPDATNPVVTKEGMLIYETTIGGKKFPLNPANIIHVPGYGFDGYRGYSPILQAQEPIALQGAAEEFGAKWFGQGSLGGLVLTHPGTLDADGAEVLRKYWQDSEGGLDNSHRLRVLQEGITVKELGIPPEAAQMLETRTFQIAEIARYWRVPLHMINELSRATFNNIESLDLQFAKYTLAPIIAKWEKELDRKLFRGADRKRFYVKFSLSSLLRSDTNSRGAFYQRASGGPIMTVNECRGFEELPPIDGGDELRSPVNMQTQQQMMDNPNQQENV